MGKVLSGESLKNELKVNPQLKVVFTNGCFDLVHLGHVTYLEEAKALGDLLVVGLNSDDSVKRLKGPLRPIQNENERAGLLAAFQCVDYVCIFDEDTPEKLIHLVEPDILVKGGDWPVDKIVGAQWVLNRGGSVKNLTFVDGQSTSNMIEKIVQRYSHKAV